MKFYKRFPGDITIKTGDLTLIEFGAYDRLLDHFYAKEQPIDPARVYIVARCQGPADRAAVDRVLAEFWTLTDDGWVQQRAEEMIAEALPRIEAAKANGTKGGRPKGSKKKPTGLFSETQQQTQTVDLQKASQSQSLSSSSKEISKPPASHPLGGGFSAFWTAWPKSERKQDKAKCADHWKRNGLDAQADAILADIATKAKTTKWQEGFIEAPLVYLRGKRWEDGVTPDGGKPGEVAKPWHDSRLGIEDKGEELGLGRWDQDAFDHGRGEHWLAYQAKVFRAAGITPRASA